MTTITALGVFIAGLLTLGTFSFLYKDNPIYKFVEHLFIGVSAGYAFIIAIEDNLIPNAYNPLVHDKDYFVIIPIILGMLMLTRLIPSISWISRYAIGFSVGLGIGMAIMIQIESSIMVQIGATIGPFSRMNFSSGEATLASINSILILVGVIAALVYFFFSKEHTGAYGKVAKLGIWTLMITFGAAFGYTVMARISLLIGRVDFLQNEWWPAIKTLLGA